VNYIDLLKRVAIPLGTIMVLSSALAQELQRRAFRACEVRKRADIDRTGRCQTPIRWTTSAPRAVGRVIPVGYSNDRRLLRCGIYWRCGLGLRDFAQRDVMERAPVHVWMAPAWQEEIERAAQKSLAVMCPACSRSPDGLLALMGCATESSSFKRDRGPDETPGLARLRRIDRLCHHASLLSRKLQNVAQRPKPPRPRAGSSHAGASPPRRCARSCWLALPPPPGSAAAGAVRSPTDRHWSPSSVAN
jgi:hypothetical protein